LNAPKSEESFITRAGLNLDFLPVVEHNALEEKLKKTRQKLPYHQAYFKETFSDELWQAMEYRSLNQSQFAEHADVTKQFLTKVFRGGNCTSDTIVKLAFALNFTAHIHLTPNDVGCEWIHQVPWNLHRPFGIYEGFLARGAYSNVTQTEKEVEYAAIPSDT
jgi:DNA-binding phage protein